MLIPRFTVRRLLLVMTICAVFFAIISIAVGTGANNPSLDRYQQRMLDPATAAAAVAIAVGSLAAVVVVHVALFVAVWLASEVKGALFPTKTAASPFAYHRPAPQLLPPENPPEM